jgi:hypothetical protein
MRLFSVIEPAVPPIASIVLLIASVVPLMVPLFRSSLRLFQ